MSSVHLFSVSIKVSRYLYDLLPGDAGERVAKDAVQSGSRRTVAAQPHWWRCCRRRSLVLHHYTSPRYFAINLTHFCIFIASFNRLIVRQSNYTFYLVKLGNACCWYGSSVRLSVCSSHSGIVSKRLNVSSKFFHHREHCYEIATQTLLKGFKVIGIYNIETGRFWWFFCFVYSILSARQLNCVIP